MTDTTEAMRAAILALVPEPKPHVKRGSYKLQSDEDMQMEFRRGFNLACALMRKRVREAALASQKGVVGFSFVPTKIIEEYRRSNELHLQYDAIDRLQPELEYDTHLSNERELLAACLKAAPAADREGV